MAISCYIGVFGNLYAEMVFCLLALPSGIYSSAAAA